MWQVVGQDRAVRLLQKSIETDRVSHAYLLSGPRQIGKSTLAREFAKALNCPQPDRPCGQCLSCRKIDRAIHPDVQLIQLDEGSKNISIDAVRALQSGVSLRPAEGMFKVYILDEAERLSEAAANSLLKTLEEPPKSVVLVLTTQDESLLLPTLVSRCQQLELKPVPSTVIEAELMGKAGMTPERARVLAALARGRVGWALEAASNPAAVEKRSELIERLVGLPSANRSTRLAYAAELATQFGRDPETARGTLELWQLWWRDVLLVGLGLENMATNADFLDRIRVEARHHPAKSVARVLAALQETISLLSQNVNTRLALEVLMLRLPRPTQ